MPFESVKIRPNQINHLTDDLPISCREHLLKKCLFSISILTFILAPCLQNFVFHFRFVSMNHLILNGFLLKFPSLVGGQFTAWFALFDEDADEPFEFQQLQAFLEHFLSQNVWLNFRVYKLKLPNSKFGSLEPN